MKNPFAGLFRARDKPQDSVSAAPTFYFGTSGSGKPVNANTAIQLSTVYACVWVISETVASLPLGVYEAKEDGNRKATEHPHPGELRHKIEIGYTENAMNENGYPAPTDVVVCRVWAAVTDAGNQHYRAADVMNTEAVINFTIRYREDIKPGMWVRFQGEKF